MHKILAKMWFCLVCLACISVYFYQIYTGLVPVPFTSKPTEESPIAIESEPSVVLETEEAEEPPEVVLYSVRIEDEDGVNVRSGAGVEYPKIGSIGYDDVCAIVAESEGVGALKWGKLEKDIGWISLDYTLIVEVEEEVESEFDDKSNEVTDVSISTPSPFIEPPTSTSATTPPKPVTQPTTTRKPTTSKPPTYTEPTAQFGLVDAESSSENTAQFGFIDSYGAEEIESDEEVVVFGRLD